MSKKENEQHLCQLIFTDPNQANKIHEFEDDLNKIISLFTDKEKPLHVPYDEISNFVYKNLDEKRLYGAVDDCRTIFNQFLNEPEDKETAVRVEKFKEDLYRHINLSILQKDLITEESRKAKEVSNESLKLVETTGTQLGKLSTDLNEMVDDTTESLGNIEKAINDSDEKIKEMKDIRKNIYTDFVSILGIFTAITFATFGGLQLLGNVFGNVKDVSFNNIGGILILGSVFIAGTYLLLISLFSGISKIADLRSGYKPSKNIVITIVLFCGFLILFGICAMILSQVGWFK